MPTVWQALSEEEKISRRQKRALAMDRIRMRAWVGQAVRNIDDQRLKRDFQKLSNEYRDEFIVLVTETLAIGDAVRDANQVIDSGLGLGYDNIDLEEIRQMAQRILTIQIYRLLLKKAGYLSNRQKMQAMDRIVARQFPRRDNVPMNVTSPQQRLIPGA